MISVEKSLSLYPIYNNVLHGRKRFKPTKSGSNKRTMLEQQMNLDLKVAYDYGREWIKQHEPITVDRLVLLASKVMARTGSEYHSIGGDFSAAKGELRKLNVTAGTGGKSYLAVDKWSTKPSLAEKLDDILQFVTDKDLITAEEIVSHFGFKPTTAKRYLRQLTEFGYLEAHGGNKNRTYTKK